ncbi:MAG: hypothetical protein IJC84_05510 [Clostridia bacterium]|nr:hypothetical protein [Clostridia bacterium]
MWDDIFEILFELFGELYCELLDGWLRRTGRRGGRVLLGAIKVFSVLMLVALVLGVLMLFDETLSLVGTVLSALGGLYVLTTLILALVMKK